MVGCNSYQPASPVTRTGMECIDPCVKPPKPPAEHRHLVIHVPKANKSNKQHHKPHPPRSPRPKPNKPKAASSPRIGTLVFPPGERPAHLLMCRFWRMGKLCPFPGCVKCHTEGELLEREEAWRAKTAAVKTAAPETAVTKTGGDVAWLASVQRQREQSTEIEDDGGEDGLHGQRDQRLHNDDHEMAYTCFLAGHEEGYLEGRAAGYSAGYADGCAMGRRGVESGELEDYLAMMGIAGGITDGV